MNSVSPIAQFRSKVQWYLDGNTPNFSSELASNLVVALKVLGREMSGVTGVAAVAALSFASWAQNLGIRDIQIASGLVDVATQLKLLKADIALNVAERRTFRDAVVQLILVAEYSSDLAFRKMVLELAQSVT